MTPGLEPQFGSTPRREEARATITKTTIRAAPGTEPSTDEPTKRGLFDRVSSRGHGELAPAEQPIAEARKLRMAVRVRRGRGC